MQEELEKLAPAADETAVWVVEAMDAQVALGLPVVGALAEARTLAVHGKKEVSVPENLQEERNFPVAHLETLILVVALNPTWTGEVKELPFVLETSNAVYNDVEENDCVPAASSICRIITFSPTGRLRPIARWQQSRWRSCRGLRPRTRRRGDSITILIKVEYEGHGAARTRRENS